MKTGKPGEPYPFYQAGNYLMSNDNSEPSSNAIPESVVAFTFDPEYGKLSRKLPRNIQQRAQDRILTLQADPFLPPPSLHHHEIRPNRRNNIIPPTYSIRVSRGYRILYRQAETVDDDGSKSIGNFIFTGLANTMTMMSSVVRKVVDTRSPY